MLSSDYLQLSREERNKHIDLLDPCILGSKGIGNKPQKVRDALSSLLDVELDCRVTICHRCKNHSNNGYCVNPKHSYIGTHSENRKDAFIDDPTLAHRTGMIWVQNAHTPEANAKRVETRRTRGSYDHRGSKNANSKLTDEERIIISTSTESTKILAERYGVSGTRIRQLKNSQSQ